MNIEKLTELTLKSMAISSEVTPTFPVVTILIPATKSNARSKSVRVVGKLRGKVVGSTLRPKLDRPAEFQSFLVVEIPAMDSLAWLVANDFLELSAESEPGSFRVAVTAKRPGE